MCMTKILLVLAVVLETRIYTEWGNMGHSANKNKDEAKGNLFEDPEFLPSHVSQNILPYTTLGP